jgi:predicted phage baseplate assembly protein
MPLAANFPVLDNRRFDDIVAEARARIPRYTPEWTDYNPGDPGFALVELFAWMTEMAVFRLNQVPKLSYLKFLQLIGIELRPAQPATGIVTLPVQAAFAGTTVTVPALTQIATAEPDEDGRPIIFETNRTLTALRARLSAVQSFDGYGYADLSAQNIAGDQGMLPFGPLATTDSALMLGFADPGELPPGVELALAFWPKSAVKEPPPSPCGGAALVASPAKIAWEFWAGTEWRPLNVASDDTLAFTRSGLVLLRTPVKGQAVKAKLGVVSDVARYWLRARIVRSSYQNPPSLLAVRANAVGVSQAQTVADEVLGGSDGTPDQVFTLANSPVLPGSLEIEVYETNEPAPWKPVDDFFGRGPDDPVYAPNWATGEIRFPGKPDPAAGKGGRIPVANIDRPQSNIVARRYRFGGGVRGNVAAGALSVLTTAVVGLDAAAVANPFAAVGGADEESIDTAMARAPRVLKARDRAVTNQDFELLAMEAGTIARAKALPLSHPEFPGIEVPGVVTVVVIPEIAAELEADRIKVAAPRPSESLLRTVCAYLDERRLLTTELYVVGPTYVPVSIRMQAVLAPDADAAETTAAIEAAVRRFLHPIYGGTAGTGWEFGGPIRYAELYRMGLVSGVLRYDEIAVTRDDQPFGDCQDVPIAAGALVELTDIAITVSDDAEGAG